MRAGTEGGERGEEGGGEPQTKNTPKRNLGQGRADRSEGKRENETEERGGQGRREGRREGPGERAEGGGRGEGEAGGRTRKAKQSPSCCQSGGSS